MRILNSKDFTNESYLESSRASLYHYTSERNLKKILEEDTLKMSKYRFTNKPNQKAICVTRSNLYRFDNIDMIPRLVLDSYKLLNDGYRPVPTHELNMRYSNNKPKKIGGNFGKSNFTRIKNGKRSIPNNLGLTSPSPSTLEHEFEERIYKDIKNVGKYILEIQYNSLSFNINHIDYLMTYLHKYTNIKIGIYNNKNRNIIEDITIKIKKNITQKNKTEAEIA